MAKNPVAANLFMLLLILGGIFGALTTKQEVFPEFDLDIIYVGVSYPGASPVEVEQGINLAIEERVRSVDGVKRVKSNASEGRASITIEVLSGADANQVLADVKGEVDRVTTLPSDAEEPEVSLLRNRRTVLSLIISGDQSLKSLHSMAERARLELLAKKGVTQVELRGVPRLEIAVEVPRAQLERHGLSLEGIAQTIRDSSLDLAAGGIDTARGELLVRVAERRKEGHQLEEILIKSSTQGTELRLGDIAVIKDGFEEQDQFTYFNGYPAVRLTAYRVGNQTPRGVSEVVRTYADELREQLPENISVTIWSDQSEVLQDRIDLLAKNAVMGSILVLVILALFLDLRLACWVALGIPVSFLGSFLFLSPSDFSINMITLFAFIVTLGMVVDDAIVVGERVYTLIDEGHPAHEAAILAGKELLVPISFAIFTSVAAFAPMLFVPGVMGKIFKMIPTVVISVLLISLVESFLILPAHLSHTRKRERPRYWISRRIADLQELVNTILNWTTRVLYQPFLRLCLRFRYITIALGLSLIIFTAALVGSGKIPFNFFPTLEGDVVRCEVQLPYGAPIEETRRVNQQVESALKRTLAAYNAEEKHRGILVKLGESFFLGGNRNGSQGSHLMSSEAFLVSSGDRDFGAEDFARRWEEEIGVIPRAEAVLVSAAAGPGAGQAVALQLTHPDNEVLTKVSIDVEQMLRDFPQLTNISNEYSSGKEQLSYTLRPKARTLGLTASSVARQLRSAFFGAQAIREQRGRNELRIMTRLPAQERVSEYDLEQLKIRSPQGVNVRLGEVVELSRGRAATSILRENGQRTLVVGAELKAGVKSPRPVLDALKGGKLDELRQAYPGLKVSFAGAQREQAEAFSSLGMGMGLAFFAIYALLAIPFKSYVQPLIIMAVIPFGLVGAVWGHSLLGYTLSIMSLFGMVALSGVVVNDSIVLIDAVNRRRSEGEHATPALVNGASSRIRPILLTSLTTFFGLSPMLAETSVQARFLIPMAISLGYGVLFATFIVLVCVPALYLMVEDSRRCLDWIKEVLSER